MKMKKSDCYMNFVVILMVLFYFLHLVVAILLALNFPHLYGTIAVSFVCGMASMIIFRILDEGKGTS